MMRRYVVIFIAAMAFACKKDKPKPPAYYPPRQVQYLVKGTHIKVNFIDSVSGFQRDRVYSDSFRYVFMRAPGTYIGITVGTPSAEDVIYGWEIRIDGKLTANAFSTGGAYFNVPYF